MLDRAKLLVELQKIKEQLIMPEGKVGQSIEDIWSKARSDEDLSAVLRSKKRSLLVPDWTGSLDQVFAIERQSHPYSILGVDGSQIYFDKHQGPSCFVINTGMVLFEYGQQTSSVTFDSHPEIVVLEEGVDGGVDAVNLYREEQELRFAAQKSIELVAGQKAPYLCLFDGTLIFFQLDLQQSEESQGFFVRYMQYLETLFEHSVVHAAYMSFPRTKELLNVLRYVEADYQEQNLVQTSSWHRFTDVDVLKLFLKPGMRTMAFQSKAPISYAYPTDLKPYFCYVHVGEEIIRLEFPSWIAQNSEMVNALCGMVLDQAIKGHGYPVVLFEAHEQAVIKSVDRDFFYVALKELYAKQNVLYTYSSKSSKKMQVPV